MNQRPLPLNTFPSLRSDDADSFIDLEPADRDCGAAFKGRGRLCYRRASSSVRSTFCSRRRSTPRMTQILLDDNLSKYAEEAPSPQSTQQADTQISSAVEILKSGELALRVTDAEKLARTAPSSIRRNR